MPCLRLKNHVRVYHARCCPVAVLVVRGLRPLLVVRTCTLPTLCYAGVYKEILLSHKVPHSFRRLSPMIKLRRRVPGVIAWLCPLEEAAGAGGRAPRLLSYGCGVLGDQAGYSLCVRAGGWDECFGREFCRDTKRASDAPNHQAELFWGACVSWLHPVPFRRFSGPDTLL